MVYKFQKQTVDVKEIDLLPCPFCGSGNLRPIHISGSYGYSNSMDYVVCENCGARGGNVEDGNCGEHLEEAIDNWNTRYSL